MRVLITRYPASEDRLIVRPLLCRRCALRLQPAEPQPYRKPESRLSACLLLESSALSDQQLEAGGLAPAKADRALT